MAKIVLQNQSSPTTPECGFTAMYVNCITWLPTFKRDDGTECSFVLSDWSWCAWDMLKCVYDPTCVYADVFAMDNMRQWTCNQYVTCDQVNCWNNKANACDIPTDVCQLCNSSNYVSNATCDLYNYYLKCETYTKEEVECMVSNFWGFCVVANLPESWCTNLIYLKWPIGCWEDKYEEWIYNSCWTLIWETSPDLSNYAKCCDIPEVPTDNCQLANWCWYVKDCDMPDLEDYAKCCDLPTDNCQLANWCGYLTTACMEQYAQLCDIPTDNCQLANSCWYTTYTWDMQKCMYDPCNCATNVYAMDNMIDWTNKVAMTTAERTKLWSISWCNTWDETADTIKCKLWICCITWCNTWDETTATIKSKLWAATCADDWYLKACDFTNFYNKQDWLVSWENIITINWCTILRCWDICICNSWWDMKACMYDPYWHCADAFDRSNHTGTQSYATITWLGTSATRDVWTNCGNVVVVWDNWKISTNILPAQDVVDVCVFPSEAAMLSWSTATRWDMAIRSDLWTTFVFSWWCYCCLCDWTELPTPASPVTSVNSKIWDVCLTTDDISDTNSSNKYVTTAEKTCWCWKADPLISWCTIKTINGCSVLWCWDLCIWDIITCVNGKVGVVCLNADDISDTGTWHLFVSQSEKNCWNCKIDCADAITDNCQLCNSCMFIDSSALLTYAKCCDIPIDNCQLCNSCWYVTWLWLCEYAKWCDLPDFSNYACHEEIPTDNCELANGCWYLSSACLDWYAKCCDLPNFSQYACCEDLPTDNCQLANSCGFTTCTWTLVACDIANLAKCCDIPTDNCQLWNTCGYTTCTWTLVASDIEDLAQCCDIPTDNCQLCNSCWYITNSALSCYAQCCDVPSISWLVQECNIATINWCCLTCWWDICIHAQWTWLDYICWSSCDEVWCILSCCLRAWCDWKNLYWYDNCKVFAPLCCLNSTNLMALSYYRWCICLNDSCCQTNTKEMKQIFMFNNSTCCYVCTCDALWSSYTRWYLATTVDYECPYEPLYAWSPATKQYVDNHAMASWSTAPANPSDWAIWFNTYDMTHYTYSEDMWTWYPLASSDWADYYCNSQPASISLCHWAFNHEIIIRWDWCTITNVWIDNDYYWHWNTINLKIVNTSCDNDATFCIWNTQYVAPKNAWERLWYNLLTFTFNTIDWVLEAQWIINILPQSKYDCFSYDKECDWVYRFINNWDRIQKLMYNCNEYTLWDWWNYWVCDYIHLNECCCVKCENQLIVEWSLTIDGVLENDWKIFII